MAVRDVTELTVYIKTYRVAMEFFETSKMLRSKFLAPNA